MSAARVTLRPESGDGDLEASYRIFRSTREEEFARAPWTDGQRDAFFRMQFDAQHTQYLAGYPDATFDLMLVDDVIAGRLYVDRRAKEIRIVDIALLPEFRARGIGSQLIRELIGEADRDGKVLSIHVEIHNPARRLYERLGFLLAEDKGMYLFMERPPRT